MTEKEKKIPIGSETAIKIFDQKNIRTAWDSENEKWYFSIIDVLAVLTESKNPTAYWRKLKQRLKTEGNQTVTNCHGLKMSAPDGKMRMTDVADTEQLFRLIQSVPSPKAEPFKIWLAKVGKERVDEIADPELTIDRALQTYRRKGYSEKWINQRLKTIEIRKELTDEWDRAGIEKGTDYAILTDEITKAWSGMTTKEYKQLKELRKESLRDNMTNLELVLNMLAEATTTEISKSENPSGLSDSQKIANRGGKVAGTARKEIIKQTGKDPVTSKKDTEQQLSNAENAEIN
ncbi:BRO-N domain-containing protein [Methanolacinia paynteri]|uniref:BRO-N domain-containing protein n=1 Tax=Methanolacinia paynteri TaxID=230356 RepID=UPI00064E1627|nr:Bro-N domain-containing protein [Methanolacinia paynteri]